MKRFKTTVTRIDEYIIEIDENIIDEEWMKDFKRYFYGFDSYEEHAEHLAQYRARFEQSFIEGYGEILINSKKSWNVKDENEVQKGINIIIESEDNDCEVEVEEIDA